MKIGTKYMLQGLVTGTYYHGYSAAFVLRHTMFHNALQLINFNPFIETRGVICRFSEPYVFRYRREL